MAVKNYTGWALGVNRIILEATTFTIGDSATKTDELENGQKRTRLKGSYNPDKYSVVMEFNWLDKDANGKTELQKFYEWYKYQHKYGVVPFEFPQIIYSPQSGVLSEDNERKITKCEYYKISSTVEGSKRGSDIQVKMTWETVYSGTVNVPTQENTISNIEANFKYIDVVFDYQEEGTAPVTADFEIFGNVNGEVKQLDIVGSYFDNSRTFRLYYDSTPLSKEGTELLRVRYNSVTYLVNAQE